MNVGRLIRYLLILYKLTGRFKYVEAVELIDYLETQMTYRGIDAHLSKRTLQRDFNDILNIFGVEIKHKKGAGYYIAERDDDPQFRYEEMLMNFDMLTSLDSESHAMGYIIPEHHRPVGSDNLPQIIQAIKEHREIYFDYTLVRHANAVINPLVKPYFIKQSLGLWYLVGVDKDGKLKTYGIDRISSLQILDKQFKRDENINPDKLFKDSFGIWDDPDTPVEEIELVYDELDGKFLKNNPLHLSQTILVDTPEEFRISLRLKITNDFVMALLSRSRSLKVIKPLSLRDRIKDIYKGALKRYE